VGFHLIEFPEGKKRTIVRSVFIAEIKIFNLSDSVPAALEQQHY